MKPLHLLSFLSLAVFFQPAELPAADPEKTSPEITGDIRSPRDGEKIQGNYDFKGRTRGAPDGFVAMAFLECIQAESFFPYGKPDKANRSFSQTIYHRPSDFGEWYIHLYVLPEADAEKLASWHSEAARLVEAGQESKIEAFDPALMDEAVKVAYQKYIVDRD
jgi:hypothetical protein